MLGAATAVALGTLYVGWLRPAPARAATLDRPPTVLGPLATRAGHFRVRLEPVRQPLEVGVTGTWLATLEDRTGKPVRGCKVALDGRMPAHGHGLPTAPQSAGEPGPGVYRIDGMRLSMPGAWELRLAVADCGARDEATFPLEL